jgi:phosphoserine aminotransferase
MKYGRIYNFSAGPSMLPEAVLEEVQAEILNYHGSGMSVMEMSHRSKVFEDILHEAEKDLRDLMGIPENYKVLFIQGGGTLQFAMVPMNLMKSGVADYVNTGSWAKKAISEAKKFGKVNVIASSEDKNFSYVPDMSNVSVSPDADYVYICENETINGTTWQAIGFRPELDVPFQTLRRKQIRPYLGWCAKKCRPCWSRGRNHP